MSLLQTVSEGEGHQRSEPIPDTEQSSGSRDGKSEAPPPATTAANPPANGSLTRVTANFTPRAMAALEEIARQTGDSRTDILNTSVMVMDVMLKMLERGGGVLHVKYPDGEEEKVRFIR